MLVYLSVCSLIGSLSVVATQGLGAAIVAQAQGTPQFNQWFLYVLLVFVVCTLLVEIVYLNKALNIFNTSIVTPTVPRISHRANPSTMCTLPVPQSYPPLSFFGDLAVATRQSSEQCVLAS